MMNDEHDPAENPAAEPPPDAVPDAEGGPPPREDETVPDAVPDEEPPTVPDAEVGESRTVAARSGADTDFPDRPIPADPVEPSPPWEESAVESKSPEPDAGPSS